MDENKENRVEFEVFQAKLDEILADEEIKGKLNCCTSLEEVQKILADNGLDLSLDFLSKLYEVELKDEELERTTGGTFDMFGRKSLVIPDYLSVMSRTHDESALLVLYEQHHRH